MFKLDFLAIHFNHLLSFSCFDESIFTNQEYSLLSMILLLYSQGRLFSLTDVLLLV